MRVLFWSGIFWPHIGGVEILAANLLPVLQERGYRFIVVTSQGYQDQAAIEHFKRIPVYRFPFRGHHANPDQLTTGLLRMKQQISRLKRTFAPDLVHINAGGLSDFFYLATANVSPAPLLATLHGDWPENRSKLVKRTLQAADWVAGCSVAMLGRARQLVPEITPRSSIIYNGLDASAFSPSPLPADAPHLLCIGRLSQEKGFDVAITAFASLVRRFPRARLMIVGEGPERTVLERQSSDLGLAHRVEFTGAVASEEVQALLNKASVVLVPSRQESFGLVALEAALTARPVVATRLGGLPEVVVHEQTGLLFENGDSDALAEAVAFLLDHPESAARMGQAARSRAQRLFSWEQYVSSYDAIYRRLLAKTKPGRASSGTLQRSPFY